VDTDGTTPGSGEGGREKGGRQPFGVVAIAMGVSGRSTVRDSLRQEQIVGSPDMTPAAIKAEAKAAGLTHVSLRTCNIAGKKVDSGSTARCFASYMRVHALEATGGLPYSQVRRTPQPTARARTTRQRRSRPTTAGRSTTRRAV
jgi:hypothetical protein